MTQPPPSLDDRVVGYAEIAARLDVEATTVKMWRRRHADFPVPLPVRSGPVFDWEAVRAWAEATGRLP
jgi:hypothetical protein